MTITSKKYDESMQQTILKEPCLNKKNQDIRKAKNDIDETINKLIDELCVRIGSYELLRRDIDMYHGNDIELIEEIKERIQWVRENFSDLYHDDIIQGFEFLMKLVKRGG